jgi:HEAT repeat protein
MMTLLWIWPTAGLLAVLALEEPTSPVVLARQLSHADAGQRLAAARDLLQLTDIPPTLTPALTAALQGPEPEVRQVAALLLARIGPPAQAALSSLEERTADPEPKVRAAALTALLRLTPAPDRLRPLLVRRTDDPDPDVRQAALLGLAMLTADPPLVLLVRNRLRDPHQPVRRTAAFVLGKWGAAATTASSALEPLCADTDWEVRFEAAQALYRINQAPAAVEVFRSALSERRQEVHRQAVLYLSEHLLDGTVLAPLIRELLERCDPAARQRLLESFPAGTAAEKAAAAGYLVQKLTDPAWSNQAMTTLVRLGPAAEPVLRQAAAHTDSQPVKERLEEALRRLERRQQPGGSQRRPPR